MNVKSIIYERLEIDGLLKTLQLDASNTRRNMTVAFCDEYDEPRNGPFHFLDHQDEQRFQDKLCRCTKRKLSSQRYLIKDNEYTFKTSWEGFLLRGTSSLIMPCLSQSMRFLYRFLSQIPTFLERNMDSHVYVMIKNRDT